MPIDSIFFPYCGRPRSPMWPGRPARPRKADPVKKAARKRQGKARAVTRGAKR